MAAQLSGRSSGLDSKISNTFPQTLLFFSKVHSGIRNLKLLPKFKPPSGMSYPTLEQLTLGASFEKDSLLLRYMFKVKKLEATATTLGLKKGKSSLEQTIPCSDYLFPGGLMNHDPLESKLEEALSKVRGKLL
jgi:hypothetical protein